MSETGLLFGDSMILTIGVEVGGREEWPTQVLNINDLDAVRQTHYLPSRVHPARAMYSALGKSMLKGCTSSFSWVETI